MDRRETATIVPIPMSEAPEIPEAEDPFAKRIAITIAILAVAMSLIGNQGDNAKTSSILDTTEAANQWAYFQAKSIKGTAYELAADQLAVSAPGDAAKRDALVAAYQAKAAAYDAERAGIKAKAEELTTEAQHGGAINDRCDLSSLLLQIAVILCSVAILVRLRPFWFLGMAVGAVGAVVGATAFFM